MMLYDEDDVWRVTFWEICGDLRSSWCRGNGPSALALAAALSGLVPEVRHMGSHVGSAQLLQNPKLTGMVVS